MNQRGYCITCIREKKTEKGTDFQELVVISSVFTHMTRYI